MRRQSFKYIALLLSCTLVLVLALQAIWMMKLIGSAKAEHTRAFREALSNTSDELQRLENLSLIKKDAQLQGKNKKVIRKTLSTKSRAVKKDTAYTSIRVSPDGQQTVMISKVEKHQPSGKSQAYASVMVSSSVTKISTGSDPIDNKVQNIDTLIKVMVMDFERKDISPRERLKTYQLAPVLRRELRQKGLDTLCEYAVFMASDTIMPLMFSNGYQKNVPQYKAALFRQDVFREKSFLTAYPLDANTYVWKGLRSALILSGCFSLIIIGLFIFTFRAILTQEKLARIKNDFINNMSHEFKTPIATISLASDTLKNDLVRSDKAQSDYYLDIIKEENKKLRKHLDRILELSVVEKQGITMQLVKTDLVALVREAIGDFKLILEHTDGHINLTSGYSSLLVNADAFYLKHAIHNLIDNAVKYCSKTPEIKIYVEQSGPSAMVRIQDNGIGMSSETRALAFEKFYRAHTGNIHAVKGFGLGLSYTQHIVVQHKGRISLQSEPGKGTTITIELPAYGNT